MDARILRRDVTQYLNRPSGWSNDWIEMSVRFILLSRYGREENIPSLGVACWNGLDQDYIMNQANENMIFIVSMQGNPIPAFAEHGWEYCDRTPYPVSSYLSTSQQTAVYVNRERKQTLVIVRKRTPKWMMLFASVMFRVIPWLIGDNPNLTDKEKTFFVALGKETPDAAACIADSLCDGFDFASKFIEEALRDWDGLSIKSLIDKARRDQEEYASQMQQYESELARIMDLFDFAKKTLLALTSTESKGSHRVMDYFKSRPYLKVREVEDNGDGKSMYFSIERKIEYYDEDAFSRALESTRSYMGSASEEIKAICKAIFLEHRGTIRTESVFRLHNLSSLTPCSLEYDSADYLRHPHLYHYNCLGGNREPINRFMASGDFDLAIDQAACATMNINFGDAVVMERMVRDLQVRYNDKCCKCIIAENGVAMNPYEFYQYITSTQKENDGGDQ